MSGTSKEGNDFRDLIAKRSPQYGGVKLTSCVVNANGSWNNYLSRFIFLSATDDSKYDRLHIYPKIQFRETRVTVERFWSFLEKIESNGELSIPGLPPVTVARAITRYPGMSELYQSGEKSFGLDWPSQVYAAIPIGRLPFSLQGDHLVAIDQPLFDSAQNALKDVFGFETSYVAWPGTVLFVVPNYTAKISGILIGPRRIELGVTIGEGTPYSELLAKVYAESGTMREQRDVEVAGPSMKVGLGVDPERCLAYLFTRKENEVLDFR